METIGEAMGAVVAKGVHDVRKGDACPHCKKPYIEHEIDAVCTTILVSEPTCTCDEDARKKREADERAKRLLEKSGMDARHVGFDFGGWMPIKGTEPMTSKVLAYVDDMRTAAKEKRAAYIDKGIGVCITGGVGTGKTLWMTRLLRYIINSRLRSVRFVRFSELSTRLSAERDNSYELREYVERLASVYVLCIDDIGECEVSDWRMKNLLHIINERYANERPTFFTSMLSMADLTQVIGAHAVSRIEQMCEGFVIRNESAVDMRRQANREKFAKVAR